MKNEARSASKKIPVENLKFMEPMASREQEEVVMFLSMIHARVRNLGPPVCPWHTDRQKSFATKAIFKWCLDRNVFQILTAGEKAEANDRVEGKVLQSKRRLKLLLSDIGINMAYSPARPDMEPKKGCDHNFKS